MISRDQIAQLAQLQSDEGIMSAYIRIEPRLMYDRKHHVTNFKGALKHTERKMQDNNRRDALKREGKKVLDFLAGWNAQGRGLAVFSGEPAGIWEVLPLEVSVPSYVDIDTTTKTAILTRLLDEYPRLAIVVIQRDSARIYLSEQRIPGPATRLTSDVPGQHDQGGWAQARFERHIEFHVAEHLKKVVDEIKCLNQIRPFRWLVVGGTEKTVQEFTGLLPDYLANKNIGSFPVDFKHEPEKDVLERAQTLRQNYERKAELTLLEQILDLSKAGGRGTIGIKDTLEAISQDRVRTLMVADGAVISCSLCFDCGHFSPLTFTRCPVCGGRASEQDATDRVVEKAFLAGAHIETAYGEARDRLLTEGGIGALLRY